MAIRTNKAIIETFEEMLDEMPFEKITVSSLAKRCEILEKENMTLFF